MRGESTILSSGPSGSFSLPEAAGLDVATFTRIALNPRPGCVWLGARNRLPSRNGEEYKRTLNPVGLIFAGASIFKRLAAKPHG